MTTPRGKNMAAEKLTKIEARTIQGLLAECDALDAGQEYDADQAFDGERTDLWDAPEVAVGTDVLRVLLQGYLAPPEPEGEPVAQRHPMFTAPVSWWAETGVAGAGVGCNRPFWLRHEAVEYVRKHGGFVRPLFTRPAPGISKGAIALTVHQALSEHSIDVSFHVADTVAQAIAALQHEGREHG